MKRFLICLLVTLSFVASSIFFHGCGAEEEVIEEKAPDVEVEKQEASEEGIEETEECGEKDTKLEIGPSSGPKGMKKAKEGEGK
jgi:hypothetical protein